MKKYVAFLEPFTLMEERRADLQTDTQFTILYDADPSYFKKEPELRNLKRDIIKNNYRRKGSSQRQIVL